MNIIGINAFGENPSACLVRDGVLTGFVCEERLNRLKGSYGLFPSRAIQWCLQTNGLTLQDVDKIAFYWGCHKYPLKMFFNLAKTKLNLLPKSSYKYKPSVKAPGNIFTAIDQLSKFSPGYIKTKIRDHLRTFGHKGPIPDIEFVEHHIAHAYQTYYQSPFKDAAILVVDGHGEENCVSAYSMKDGNLKKVFGYDIPYSLGWFYGAFTAYLGFFPNRDEGKVMGLAAFGEARKENNPWLERMEKILKITPEGFELDPLYVKFGGHEFHPKFTDHLVKYITSFDPELTPIGYGETFEQNGEKVAKYMMGKYVDLAYAAQTQVEKALAALASRVVRETGLKNLCVVGGVAMNCKANSHIYDNSGVENIFIHPASSDDGSSIGAAFYLSRQLDPNFSSELNTLKHVQLGPSYSNDEIEKVLKACSVNYTKPDDVCSEAAQLLAQGKFLGWFQGGCEMGARALGGRSIVACPERPEIKELINKRVKFREVWRPYCPSMMAEHAGDYIEDSFDTPYMILARRAKPNLIEDAPSVVHVDDTIRPQTVEKEVLPKWHSLIENVKTYSGYPVVLNTSFNIRGEPIVCSPYDAVRTFFSTGLDNMAIGDFLLTK